jgi:molybdenum cofactor biosynthesis enzyme MoaA
MDKAEKFNIDKYKEILEYINSNIIINNFNFTGGEPTLNYHLFKEVFDMTHKILKYNKKITIHTNGINLDKLMTDKQIFDNLYHISLSRHHYNYRKNIKIFKTDSIPTNTEIKKLQSGIKNKNILNFSCNLINDYIDNNNEILKYLDMSANMNVTLVGFVSLMKINDFCKNNYISFNDLIKETTDIINTKNYNKSGLCSCSNYLYISEKYNKVIRVYNKSNNISNYNDDTFTFNGNNLVFGYNDNDIVY